jgi:putative addiction module component (TIGR02574 family)
VGAEEARPALNNEVSALARYAGSALRDTRWAQERVDVKEGVDQERVSLVMLDTGAGVRNQRTLSEIRACLGERQVPVGGIVGQESTDWRCDRVASNVTGRLEAAALALPREERAQLARRLIESLDDDPQVEEAWAIEIQRRLDAIDRGEVEMIPAEQVLAEARRRVGA